ncbi:hypothetical protein HDV04_004250 [Boothiomyces sp. JEL0838]|nr:hypothetical protein HDV04_004250 [Boothiomyces sp. JEL0838]
MSSASDSPLNMLASVIANPSSKQVQGNYNSTLVKVTPIGMIQGKPVDIFTFPSGTYFTSDALNLLFFKTASVVRHLSSVQSIVYQDVQTKTIYIPSEALKQIAETIGNLQLGALAKISADDVVKGGAKLFLSSLDGLVLHTKNEATITMTVSQYIPEQRTNVSEYSPERGTKRPATESENGEEKEPKSAKTRNKRLSIDTRFSEKLENNSVILEQMKSSYKLKQQQQAIIDSRTRGSAVSAHPDSGQSGLRLNIKKPQNGLNSIEQLVSPRSEFPTRELPRPRGYEMQTQSAHPLSQPSRLPSPTGNNTAQKQQFMSMMEQIYESSEQTARLQSQLKEQIRKSATLLYTLSSSGQMIEGLVRSHFRDMQTQYSEKFGLALTDLNRRLVAIEQRTFGSSKSDAFTPSGALKSLPKDESNNSLSSIADRVENLERSNYANTE